MSAKIQKFFNSQLVKRQKLHAKSIPFSIIIFYIFFAHNHLFSTFVV